MENLQKIAETVHAEFVAQSIKQLEETAHAGGFEESISGTLGEVTALQIALRALQIESILYRGLMKSTLFVQWHTRA